VGCENKINQHKYHDSIQIITKQMISLFKNIQTPPVRVVTENSVIYCLVMFIKIVSFEYMIGRIYEFILMFISICRLLVGVTCQRNRSFSPQRRQELQSLCVGCI